MMKHLDNITAVEWLKEKVKETYDKEGKLPLGYILNLIAQAKAMEKEQITDAYIMGSYDMAAKEFRPEQYYNEVYGGEGTPDTSSPNIKNK